MTPGTLNFFCGKMGAGKSTLARELATRTDAVLLSEDHWLGQLYPGAIATVADYRLYSDRLKPLIRDVAQGHLRRGQDVVLDFPANTPGQRAWLKGLSDAVGAPHRLYLLDVPDAVCLSRLAQRGNPGTDTPEMFERMKPYFSSPDPQEGLTVVAPPA